MQESIIIKFLKSWKNENGTVNSTENLLEWISGLNKSTYVSVNECSINDSNMWFYNEDSGEIMNKNRSFFSIKGLRYSVNDSIVAEQPIIIQPEIGYLGIICKEINGVLNFLMQAKIEPGNINCVQISPTIQATKSNFTRVHGGKTPKYLEFFENSEKYNVIYDQIQSEQAARFYKKRNRNMIMLIDENIEVYSNFKWMTLGQIKKLMEIDNLVNMDTRTVLSGIPFAFEYFTDDNLCTAEIFFDDKSLFNSMFKANSIEVLPKIYRQINDYKMFQDIQMSIIPLTQLVDWEINEFGITCKNQANFMVRYYDIEIAGREIHKWTQPLIKAIGIATFGLFVKKSKDVKMFLIKINPEIGSFDKVELGPTVQWESSHSSKDDNQIDKIFRTVYKNKKNILCDVMLSEEGGRFYHEQNRNIIIEIDENELIDLPDGYIWSDYGTLNLLIQVNNCLNIQLRNLLSLLKI